ncbi:hypothetical protein F4808DRAFT_419920 [Astrocystis sublimbata]|nr:hypothetical protein F4808DRAFT_419920 [Astrocystis sublimbata]
MATSRSSFGVELEFLVAVADCHQQLDAPAQFEDAPGAPILLPPNVLKRGVASRGYIFKRGQETIRKAVAKNRGARVVSSQEETLADPDKLHLRFFSDWEFGTDPSVSINFKEPQEQYVDLYFWFAVEITSPALWDQPESWAEIRAVVDAFKQEYWIMTPRSAGMHFHYGNGKDYIPFEKLRRMAALLVAADPLLVQLHPEHRKENEHCMSNRLYSRIAHGRPAVRAAREIGAEYTEGEPEFPSCSSKARPEPVAREVRRRTATLSVAFRRGQLTGYELNEFFEQAFRTSGYIYDDMPDENPRPAEIAFAVREILRCTNAPTVAELMRITPEMTDRPCYNFRSYLACHYKRMIKSGEEYETYFQHKRTVEFRQMASTMESDEVVAFGKVVVRLCEVAAELSIEELWGVVLDCALAETHGSWYDVFDLLGELGLESEARVLQMPVARFRGELVPQGLINDPKQIDTFY